MGDHMINIAVCDDEAFTRNELRDRLSVFFKGQKAEFSVCCFDSGEALLESPVNFQIILLDIKMNGTDGMETAKQLRRQRYGGILIFVTVLGECVYDSFEVSAYDYLVKPVSSERLEKTLLRLMSDVKRNSGSLTLRSGADTIIIPLDDIVFCEVLDKKIYIHRLSGGTDEFCGRLEELEQKLGGRFFKCHRSYLINLKYIESFGSGSAVMRHGIRVPVSRLRQKSLSCAVADYFDNYGGQQQLWTY